MMELDKKAGSSRRKLIYATAAVVTAAVIIALYMFGAPPLFHEYSGVGDWRSPAWPWRAIYPAFDNYGNFAFVDPSRNFLVIVATCDCRARGYPIASEASSAARFFSQAVVIKLASGHTRTSCLSRVARIGGNFQFLKASHLPVIEKLGAGTRSTIAISFWRPLRK